MKREIHVMGDRLKAEGDVCKKRVHKKHVNVVATRNFRRYKKERVFQLKLGIETYKCKTIEYSFQGICLHILDDTFSLVPGDRVAFSIHDPEMDFQGEVLWINEAERGHIVCFKRTANLKGNCQDFQMSDILTGLHRSMKTGLLLIVEGCKLTTIYLRNGKYIFASSNSKDDRLGEFLLKRGKITLPQYVEVSERLKKTGKRLGYILVERGYFQDAELHSCIKLQVENIILKAFDIEFGTFEFREGKLPIDESIIFELNAANLIYRGVRNIMSIVNILESLPPLESVLSISDNPAEIFQDISLDDVGKKILSLVICNKTIKEILSAFPEEGYFEAVNTIYALLCARIIVNNADNNHHDTIPDENIREEYMGSDASFIEQVNELFYNYRTINFYDILDLHGEEAEEEIKEAYWRKTKQFHPDNHSKDHSEDIKKKLTYIFSHINSVYDTLSHPEKRRRYDESLCKAHQGQGKNSDETDSKRIIAQDLFNKGKVEMMLVKLYTQDEEAQSKVLTGYLHSAIKLFFKSISFDNTRPDYHFHFGVALGMNKMYRESVTALNKAIELESSNANYFSELGHLFLKLGFYRRANSAFENALNISPSDTRALEGISIMMEQ